MGRAGPGHGAQTPLHLAKPRRKTGELNRRGIGERCLVKRISPLKFQISGGGRTGSECDSIVGTRGFRFAPRLTEQGNQFETYPRQFIVSRFPCLRGWRGVSYVEYDEWFCFVVEWGEGLFTLRDISVEYVRFCGEFLLFLKGM